jgi:hypothetical protein
VLHKWETDVLPKLRAYDANCWVVCEKFKQLDEKEKGHLPEMEHIKYLIHHMSQLNKPVNYLSYEMNILFLRNCKIKFCDVINFINFLILMILLTAVLTSPLTYFHQSSYVFIHIHPRW